MAIPSDSLVENRIKQLEENKDLSEEQRRLLTRVKALFERSPSVIWKSLATKLLEDPLNFIEANQPELAESFLDRYKFNDSSTPEMKPSAEAQK